MDRYSDLVITCGAETFNVHKLVVCSRVDFFDRAVNFGGQLSGVLRLRFVLVDTYKETTTGKIDLPDDEPAIVKLVLQYLYEGNYDSAQPNDGPIQSPTSLKSAAFPNSVNEVTHTCVFEMFGPSCTEMTCPHHTCTTTFCRRGGRTLCCMNFRCPICSGSQPVTASRVQQDAEDLLTHAKMHETADKYGVTGLKDLVADKFRTACQNHWDSDSFAPAANLVYSSTPENDKVLRKIVVATIFAHARILIQKPAVAVLLTEVNGLVLELFRSQLDASVAAFPPSQCE